MTADLGYPEVDDANFYAYASLNSSNPKFTEVEQGTCERFLLTCCNKEFTGEKSINPKQDLYPKLNRKFAGIKGGILSNRNDFTYFRRSIVQFDINKCVTAMQSEILDLFQADCVTNGLNLTKAVDIKLH